MRLPRASASRPISSWTAARSDQALHQSSHELSDRVTSSKSGSATPLATKRAPQCAIAELIRVSVAMVLLLLDCPLRPIAAHLPASRADRSIMRTDAPLENGRDAWP